MSYYRRSTPKKQKWGVGYQALGGVSSIVSNISTAAEATSKIVSDPALPTVANLVLRLHRAQQPKTASGAPAGPPVAGVGLSKIVKPLQLYVYSQENQWVMPAIIGGILALPFLLGRISKK